MLYTKNFSLIETEMKIKMKKLILTFSIMLIYILQISISPNQLWAQRIRTSNAANTYILTGSIDKNPITMILTIDDENVARGKYYYHRQKRYINIDGNATLNGAIVLKETSDTKMLGEFIGYFDIENTTFSGDWIELNTKKSMPFNLSKASPINHIETLGIYYFNEFEYSFEYIKLYGNSQAQGLNVLNKIFEDNATRNSEFILLKIEDYKSNSINRNYYAFDFDMFFVYADDNIISIGNSYDEHTGTTSRYGGQTYNVYDIKTGELLSQNIANLVADKNNNTLVNLVKRKLLTNYKRSDFINFDKITLNDNFYIDVEGVHFVYNKYEIANGSLEKISISFTFNQLKPFINKTSPFYYLFV